MDAYDMLSSKSVMARKAGIRMLKQSIASGSGYMAALTLRYVAEHDPVWTVRNTARAALYVHGFGAEEKVVWDKAYAFGKG